MTILSAQSLAHLLEAGRGGPKDVARALSLYDLVCRNGIDAIDSLLTSCADAQRLRARTGSVGGERR